MFGVEPALRVAPAAPLPALASEVERRVEVFWRAALDGNPALFNGQVFSVDEITPQRLAGHWTEDRRIVAQFRDPALAGVLRVRPLAVAGLIEGPDGIVFGRRPASAVYQPGLWQLAPAGNVDPQSEVEGRIDLGTALAIELREELGLGFDTVSLGDPVCMVEHPGIGVLDLCMALRTALPAAAIYAAHRAGGDGEYPEIAVVPRTSLRRFVAEQEPLIAPQVLLFLSRHGLLTG